MAVETLHAAEAGVLGSGLDGGGHQLGEELGRAGEAGHVQSGQAGGEAWGVAVVEAKKEAAKVR